MAQYVVDKTASRFTVRAFASGMLAAMGHNPTIAIRGFSGKAEFDPAAPAKATLRMEIDAGSLEVTDDIKSKDKKEMENVMNRDVLDSGTHPAIVFDSAATAATDLGGGRFQVSLNGNLTLRGTTDRLPVTAQVALMSDMLRASGEFSLLQSDFGIPLVSVAGGALKLKDELKFSFDIVVRRQE